MHEALLIVAVVFFLLSGFAPVVAAADGRFSPSLLALGLAAFAGSFLAPLL